MSSDLSESLSAGMVADFWHFCTLRKVQWDRPKLQRGECWDSYGISSNT